MTRSTRVFRTLSILTFFAGAAACAVTQAPAGKVGVAPIGVSSATPDSGVLVAARCEVKTRVVDAGVAKADSDYVPEEPRIRKPQTNDVCEMADDNILRATKEILADVGRAAPVTSSAWDKKTEPAYLKQIDQRFTLTSAEKQILAKNGFVVMPRQSFSTYAWALHDVYQSQVPIYVSMDSLMFAIFSSNDKLIAQIERASLLPKLKDTLATLHCALADEYPSFPKDVARDLDVYLTVARSLLDDAPVTSILGNDDQVKALVDAAKKSEGFANVDLFGRTRFVDWSQYKPRGHYADKPAGDGSSAEPSGLEPFFRSAMWLSRLELNLVSRSSRSSEPGELPNTEETPEEDNVAIALSILAEKSGALRDLDTVTNAWTLLAGKREDVSLDDLISLRKKAGIVKVDDHSAAALRLAIGNDFQRTARFHRMPEGSNVLPAIMTMLGPRVTPDAPAFMPIVHSRVPERHMVHAGDVGALLGLDSAREYLKDDLVKYPSLGSALDESKRIVANAPDGNSLYDAWFFAIRSLADSPPNNAPTFMRTPAFGDLTLNSLVSSYGEIRHNYVLMAGQPYDEGGCVIPDGYVEPRPKTLDYLLSYTKRGKDAMRELDPQDSSGAQAYFDNLASTLTVLRRIVQDEVEGRPLSPAEKRFLSLVAELTPGSSGGGPTYTGWYFDMFRTRENEALTTASFVADYFTSSYDEKVAYLGARSPALGVFVVDTGGGPHAVVGPVARAFEAEGPVKERLTDDTIDKADKIISPWTASYEAPIPKEVPLSIVGLLDTGDHAKMPTIVRVRAKTAQARVTVSLLDHNRRVLATTTKSIAVGKRAEYKFPRVFRENVSGVRVTIGEYSVEGFGNDTERSVSIQTGGMEMGEHDYDDAR